MKEINKIAFCSMMCSLSVAIMFIGSIFCYSTLLVAACGGFISIIVAQETSFVRSLNFYFVVIILTNLFIPRKGVLFDYLLFVGIYPIIGFEINKIKNFITRFGLKLTTIVIFALIVLNFGLLISGINEIQLKKLYIFGFIEVPIKNLKLLGFYMLVFWGFCYDIFLQEFIGYYKKQLKPKFFKCCFKF